MKYVPYAVQSWVVGPKLDDILVAVLEMATSAECEISHSPVIIIMNSLEDFLRIM